MTRAEQETIIRWDEDEQVAHCYTCSPRILRLWTRKGYAIEPDPARDGGFRTKLPFRMIRWGKPMSEAQRESSSRRARQQLGLRNKAGLSGSNPSPESE